MVKEHEILIIGGGPAGLSSAIYTTRADFDTLVFDKGDKLIEKAEVIENYFGFPDGISGKELIDLGKKQAEKFGAEIIKEEALLVKPEDEKYRVETAENMYEGDGLILAPGIKHEKPSIERIEEFEGKGVSYCVTCDAPLYRDKKVGLIGSRDYGAKEALELYEFSENLTIYTNGNELEIKNSLRKEIEEKNIDINKDEIKSVFGDEIIEGLELENKKVKLDGLFVAVGTSGAINFAKSLGIPTEGQYLDVNKDLSTGLPRLYAAGDCTGGARQLSVAVGEGAEAALNLIEDLRGSTHIDWREKD